MIVTGAVIVTLLVATGTLFWKYTKLKDTPTAKGQATTKRILGQVGEHYALPTGEEPTIAQVKDKSKLTGQAFYKDAQNGDYIIIYTGAKVALLYRESTHKIINVGPVSVENKPAVSFLNGSGISDKAQTAVNSLGDLLAQLNVSANAPDAKNKNTPKTVVVDISGKFADQTKALASKLNGTVETALPSGETAPSGADIVVVLGKS